MSITTSAPSAALGAAVSYTINYSNPGHAASQSAVITDSLPWGLDFVSADNGGTYDPASRTVTWNLGTVNAGSGGGLQLTTQVSLTAATLLSSLINEVQYSDQDLVVVPIASASTLVSPIPLP